MAAVWEPDLLLTDVMMPQMTGIEAAIQIRLVLPSCKVLLFSGEPQTAREIEDTRLDGKPFELIDKPIHPTVLLDKLRTLWE
jgi:CheY-like chemotaxis protein